MAKTDLHFEPLEVGLSHLKYIFLTKETSSNDTKVHEIATLTVTFTLKITILDYVATRGIHVSQTHLIFC